MSSVANNEYCYGCGVCVISCPVKAIKMTFNDEGFYKPMVDKNVCVNCGICSNVCSYNSSGVLDVETNGIKSFASCSG